MISTRCSNNNNNSINTKAVIQTDKSTVDVNTIKPTMF